jgi:hypothetical protein
LSAKLNGLSPLTVGPCADWKYGLVKNLAQMRSMSDTPAPAMAHLYKPLGRTEAAKAE